jgi:hypothetical protein
MRRQVVEEIVKAALKIKRQQREAADRRIFLRSRVSQLSPSGNFTLPILHEMAGYRWWFSRIPHRELKRVKLTVGGSCQRSWVRSRRGHFEGRASAGTSSCSASAIRDYLIRLTGLFKNLNYSQEETAQGKEFLNKIRELADFNMNPNFRSQRAKW